MVQDKIQNDCLRKSHGIRIKEEISGRMSGGHHIFKDSSLRSWCAYDLVG